MNTELYEFTYISPRAIKNNVMYLRTKHRQYATKTTYSHERISFSVPICNRKSSEHRPRKQCFKAHRRYRLIRTPSIHFLLLQHMIQNFNYYLMPISFNGRVIFHLVMTRTIQIQSKYNATLFQICISQREGQRECNTDQRVIKRVYHKIRLNYVISAT
jgi:hypothetical protein